MAMISIEYCGGNYPDEDDNLVEAPIDYRSVILYLSSNEEFIFESGYFPKDWYQAKKKFLEVADEELYFLHSSSVDHFIMDGAPFDSVWVVFDDDEGNAHLEYTDIGKGWELFVDKGTQPTWEELKKLCKNET